MKFKEINTGLSQEEILKNEVQDNLIHYLSNLWGHQERPERIVEDARKENIDLDLDTAVNKGLIGALKNKTPENLELILAFAKIYNISVDLSEPEIQQAVTHCYSILLSKTLPLEVSDLQKFINKHELVIDKDYIFQQALVITLSSGDGRKANSLANKIKKDERDIDISDSEIKEALQQGLIKALVSGRAEEVNRLMTFSKKGNINVQTDEEAFVNATKEGLAQSFKDMRLGPGGVSFAEGMVKLVKKLKIPVDIKSPELIEICRELLTTTRASSELYPKELRTFSAPPHIEYFLKQNGIKID